MTGAFLSGVIAAASLTIAAFFWRFWQRTRDRLFLFFCAAFVMMTLERIMRALVNLDNEMTPLVYGVRLVSFLLIIAGVVDKNRQLK
jgi:hypothetical protein